MLLILFFIKKKYKKTHSAFLISWEQITYSSGKIPISLHLKNLLDQVKHLYSYIIDLYILSVKLSHDLHFNETK